MTKATKPKKKPQTQVIIQHGHSNTAALESQYEDIAARLRRCDKNDVAWLFGTMANVMDRVGRMEAGREHDNRRVTALEGKFDKEFPQNHMTLEVDA